MKKYIVSIGFLLGIWGYAQQKVLVSKDNQDFITQKDFEEQFDYTLKNDKSRTYQEVLDQYLEQRIIKDLVLSDSTINKNEYGNSMIAFLKANDAKYKKEEPIGLQLQKQLGERFQNEVQLVQYVFPKLDDKTAKNYQKQFEKNTNYLKTIKGKEVDLGFVRAGALPIDLEDAIYNNLKENAVLPFAQTQEGTIFTKIKKVRPYSGDYLFQLLLIKDNTATGKAKIEELYQKAIGGEKIETLVAENSQDEASKKQEGYVQASGQILDEQLASVVKGLAKEQYSKPFQTKFGWNFIKMKDFITEITPEVIESVFKSSQAYEFLYNNKKMAVVTEKYQPQYREESIVALSKNTELLKELQALDYKKEDDKSSDALIAILQKNQPQPVIKFKDGLEYNTNNFVYDNILTIKEILKGKDVENQFKEFSKYNNYLTLVRTFDNSQQEINPKYRQETELQEFSLASEIYTKHLAKLASENQKDLNDLYQKEKSNYQWKERAEIEWVYCGKDEETAKEIAKKIKKTSLDELQKKYEGKEVYFKTMKKELSSADLPKGYDVSKKIQICKENGNYYVVKTLAKLPVQDPTLEELKPVLVEKLVAQYRTQNIENYKKAHQIKLN